MNPEEELVCLLMNYIDRNKKLLHIQSILKEKFIIYLESDSKIKQKLCSSDKEVAILEQENELLWLNSIEILKQIEEDEQELEKLSEENKQLCKQLKKRQTTCNSIDFKVANDDLNILSKKMIKLSNLKKITKLFIDSSAPKNIQRGFSVNLERNELNCFETTKDSENFLWGKIIDTSEYMNEWKNLFEI